MATKITREILESYLYCKTKASLQLVGEQGNKSDYEVLLAANRQEVRQQAIGKILAKHSEEYVARDISLTADELRTGRSYMLSAVLEDDLVSLRFDGLKKSMDRRTWETSTTSRCCFTRGGRSGRSRRSCWNSTACSCPGCKGECLPMGSFGTARNAGRQGCAWTVICGRRNDYIGK
jgi:hypothetical protein